MRIQTINPEAAVSALGLLALRYAPKPMPWTDPNADQDTRTGTMRTWVDAMRQHDEAAVLAAFERACIDHPEWPPNLNVMTALIQAEARNLATRRASEQRRELALRCDSTGWIETPTPNNPDQPSMRPCPSCHPFLDELYQEGILHTCNGQDFEDRRTKWINENGGMPARCLPNPQPDDTLNADQAKAAIRQLADQLNQQ